MTTPEELLAIRRERAGLMRGLAKLATEIGECDAAAELQDAVKMPPMDKATAMSLRLAARAKVVGLRLARVA